DAALHQEHARVLEARGDADGAAAARLRAETPENVPVRPSVPAPTPVQESPLAREPVAMPVEPDALDADDWAKQFDWDGLVTTFADIAGLEEVKRQIRLKIVAPFEDPALYRAFGRTG